MRALLEAGDELARRLHAASVEHPKPAPCVPHRRADGYLDCPNCVALAAWEEAKEQARACPLHETPSETCVACGERS